MTGLSGQDLVQIAETTEATIEKYDNGARIATFKGGPGPNLALIWAPDRETIDEMMTVAGPFPPKTSFRVCAPEGWAVAGFADARLGDDLRDVGGAASGILSVMFPDLEELEEVRRNFMRMLAKQDRLIRELHDRIATGRGPRGGS